MPTLGIDPGIASTGYGLIKEDGERLKVIDYGCIKTQSSLENTSRLKILYRELKAIVKKYKPKAIAIEKLFFAANRKTAMAVGQAKGIVILAAAEMNLKVIEYTPLEIKVAITGYGKADKKQMQSMVKTLLKLKSIPKPDDAADALAVAICHLHSYKLKGLS